MNRSTPISAIKGFGPKTESLFQKIGVYTAGDILLHFPRTYVKYPAVKAPEDVICGDICAVRGMLAKTPLVKNTRSMPVTTAYIGDGEHKIEMVWFRKPYIKNQLIPGTHYIFYGTVQSKNGHMVMEQPDIFTTDKYKAMEEAYFPVYSITKNLTNNQVIKAVRAALECDDIGIDSIPQSVASKYHLTDYENAIRQIHFPDNMDSLITARKRLVFDEFFWFILQIQYQKESREKDANEFVFTDDDFIDSLIGKLPYELTGAQKRALEEVERDLNSPYVMQRLIQGDVGSGKTIIAFLAMAYVSHSGYQSAIMAPTEVLARQHYETFTGLCETFGLKIPVVLLTGSMTAKQKRMAYEAMQLYENAMIIGTHAIIQEKALYDNLALVITDEQHRFGVRQREMLSEKGTHPHILVMSATPIPRTLAIIIYGDLDISVVDEVPARRLPIKNCVVGTIYRRKAYEFIEKEVRAGHQAYVICPLVEATENMDSENVTDYVKKLRENLPEDISLGLLHGQMKPSLKNSVMDSFLKGEIDVLVSTTVVEVGVNVPNATVMMIENAERFGLAGLHQLRGRVGRGDAQSYCIMVNTSESKAAQKRLEILNKSNDGFHIASEDLKLRGPGDFFGIRQSGDMQFEIADIYQDADVLKEASEAVGDLLIADPELKSDDNAAARERIVSLISDESRRMNL